MRTYAVLALIVCYLSITAASLRAQSAFDRPALQNAPSARANGMGGAYVAVADDANACWWNPGALAFLSESNAATLTYARMNAIPEFESDPFDFAFVGFVKRVARVNIGGSLAYFDYGKSTFRDSLGNVAGDFRSYEFAPFLGIGIQVNDGLGAGLGVKVVRVSLVPASVRPDGVEFAATALAVDFGLLWRIARYRTRCGLTFQNLGTDLDYPGPGPRDPLPRNLKAGIAYVIVDRQDVTVLGLADLNQPFTHRDDGGPILNAGVEWMLFGIGAFRFGYIYEGWYNRELPIHDPTVGGGLHYRNFSFDYAVAPIGPAGRYLSHHLSIGASF